MSPKTFIVTGASKGIGSAIVQRLLRLSHNVVLTARSDNLLETVKKSNPGRVEYVAGDITDPTIVFMTINKAIKTFGRIDGLVINHSVLDPKKLCDSSLEAFQYVYDVNVFSGLALAQAALEQLRKSNGCIIWVSSGAATKAYTAWGAYGSSKAAVNHLSAHLAAEEPEITSICVAPGRVDTDMQGVIRSQKGQSSMSKEQYENFVEAFESGKLLKPEQPGNVIANIVAEPLKELSGKFVSWNSPELAAYQQ